MSFRFLPKSVTLNDLERRNGPYLWPPCITGCGHMDFHPVVSSFFFISPPNLSRRTLDVYHTSTHAVALVQI